MHHRVVLAGYCLTSRCGERLCALCSGDVTTCALCHSLLSVINKFALMNFPFPTALVSAQYLTSAVFVVLLRRFDVSGFFNRSLAMRMLPGVLCLYCAIFSNMKVCFIVSLLCRLTAASAASGALKRGDVHYLSLHYAASCQSH